MLMTEESLWIFVRKYFLNDYQIFFIPIFAWSIYCNFNEHNLLSIKKSLIPPYYVTSNWLLSFFPVSIKFILLLSYVAACWNYIASGACVALTSFIDKGKNDIALFELIYAEIK